MNPSTVLSISVDINRGRKKVQVNKGSSLLAGLARNGVFIPSACGGNARCGYCKIKVISPDTPPTPPELALLSDLEKKDGVRLACQTKPEKNIAIEIPEELFSVKRFSGKVLRKKMYTYDILGLSIGLVNPSTIDFRSGQYLQLKSMPYDGKEAVLRDFSIASSPSQKNSVELMIRRIPNGIFTPWAIDVLKEGDSISFSGPYGKFGATNTGKPMLCIAGGSGMAPMWSILQDMREKKSNRRIHYFFGALTQKDLFLVEELNGLKKELADFTFTPALSNEPADSDWDGERGLITEVVARIIPDCSDYEAYLCGSPGMINACLAVLKKGGMKDENIFYDKFA
ncbi:MAG TPA: FAD-binding oxidoreductase [Chitinivibrionales bacterium]|nr:FAD-binding oxidoreductase [Chitinivibrionales bacterium]